MKGMEMHHVFNMVLANCSVMPGASMYVVDLLAAMK